MKHIKFSEAEPILGIQRVRNVVFLDKRHYLHVAYQKWARLIKQALIDAGIKEQYIRFAEPNDNNRDYRISFRSDYHFEQPMKTIDDDEIIVFKGYDNIWLEDSIGNMVGDIDLDNEGKWTGVVLTESECYK